MNSRLTVGGQEEAGLLALVRRKCANCVRNHPYISSEDEVQEAPRSAVGVPGERDSAAAADCKPRVRTMRTVRRGRGPNFKGL